MRGGVVEAVTVSHTTPSHADGSGLAIFSLNNTVFLRNFNDRNVALRRADWHGFSAKVA